MLFRTADIDADDVSPLETEYSRHTWRKILITIALLAAVLLVAMFSLSVNGRGLNFLEVCDYVLNHILGTEYVYHSVEWYDDYMLWNIYMPRVCLGVFLGAGLAICGVAMQSVMSNPLADAYTTGISDGACFGAVAAIVTGFSLSSLSGSMGIVTSAFVGGLIPAIILIVLSTVIKMGPATMILVGVGLSYFFSGLEAAIMVGTDADSLAEAYLWQIGSLGDITSWGQAYLPIVVTIVGCAILWLLSNKLNLLTLGDDSAKSLGLNVRTFKALVMIIVSIVVASLVSYVGIVGFVGLVAPHLVRMIIGANNRYLIPASALAGALLILIADLIARTVVSPGELRLGVIVMMIGSPIFLYIILSRKKSYGEVFRRGTHCPRWRRHTHGTTGASWWSQRSFWLRHWSWPSSRCSCPRS